MFTFHGSVALRQGPRKRVVCIVKQEEKIELKISGKNFKCLSLHAECELKQIEKLIPVRRLVKSLN